jgi:hypothetical protein
VNAFFLRAGLQEREGLAFTALSSVQMRHAGTLLACHAYHWTAGGLSRSHSEGFERGIGWQQRVAEKGRALMQRFCQVFVESLGMLDACMWRTTTAAWCACLFRWQAGCDAQAAVWTGGDYDGVRS